MPKRSCCPMSKILRFFKATCDENRQKILDVIKNNNQINATQINKKVKLSQPTVSHHLKILIDAGVITVKKEGKESFYSLNHKNIKECCHKFSGRYCG